MDNLMNIFSMDMVNSTIRMAIPLVLAAIGGTVCERSGVINLGLEGMLLSGAFGAVFGTYLFHNPWLGILAAILVGGLFGLIHAVLCLKYKTDQTVSGVGINIFVSGLTVVLTRVIWKSDGMSEQVEKLPTFSVPVLKDIPVLGELFTRQSPFVIITLAIVVCSWFIIYRTKAGLRLRAIGDHPQAAETVGIKVTKYRYICVVISGMLCGLGGAYLSIVQSHMFVKDMVAGRGFMALAAMILGAWNPLGALGASLVFSFAQALRMNLQADIPNQFMLILPYVITLVVLVFFGRKAKGPQASGKVD